MRIIRPSIAIIVAFIAVFIAIRTSQHEPNTPSPTLFMSPSITPSPPQTPPFIAPLTDPFNRVTKKMFGTKVAPGNSPVSPERFHGYHTGVDFEIFPGEENVEIPIVAACNGIVLVKKSASGYGGVVSERCDYNGAPVTVIYGHLKLSSVTLKEGDSVEKGEHIGILGKGFSTETDGERKHLHFAIHKGSEVDLRGYVATKEELSRWQDPLIVLEQMSLSR